MVYELRHDDVFLVVLGGLVPELLVRDDDLIPAPRSRAAGQARDPL